MDSSATSSFDKVLDCQAGMEHDLFVDVFELAEQVPFYGAKVSDDETFGNVVGIEQFRELLQAIDNF